MCGCWLRFTQPCVACAWHHCMAPNTEQATPTGSMPQSLTAKGLAARMACQVDICQWPMHPPWYHNIAARWGILPDHKTLQLLHYQLLTAVTEQRQLLARLLCTTAVFGRQLGCLRGRLHCLPQEMMTPSHAPDQSGGRIQQQTTHHT